MAKFITFEGVEGSGKSTQLHKLKVFLESHQQKVISTREPGGTPLAEQIRALLLNQQEINDATTEFLLLSAARRDHVEKLIKPALAEGNWVICDRFADSSTVYQGIVKGMSSTAMQEIMHCTLNDFQPDLTILLDIPASKALKRLQNRQETNHYDHKGLDFHASIRQGFLSLSQQFPQRIKVINAEQSVEEIADQIAKILQF